MTYQRSLVEHTPDLVIHVSCVLKCSPADAWRCFTVNERLESWLTGKADTVPSLNGKYELYWEPTSPEENSTIGCVITALSEPWLLAFQWRSPAQFKAFTNGADPLTHVVVSFFPEGDSTRVELVHSGWRSATEWREAYSWQKRAWQYAFAELERAVTPNPSIEATS